MYVLYVCNECMCICISVHHVMKNNKHIYTSINIDNFTHTQLHTQYTYTSTHINICVTYTTHKYTYTRYIHTIHTYITYTHYIHTIHTYITHTHYIHTHVNHHNSFVHATVRPQFICPRKVHAWNNNTSMLIPNS